MAIKCTFNFRELCLNVLQTKGLAKKISFGDGPLAFIDFLLLF
jgi:hypothetical protein